MIVKTPKFIKDTIINMIQKGVTLLFFIFSLLYTNISIAQTDSLLLTRAVNNAKQVYYSGIGDQAAKFNGRQYQGYTESFTEGHPYYRSSFLTKGSIVYDGLKFDDLNLLYDEVRDCVVFQDSTHRIQLVNEKLSEFNIEASKFKRLVKKEGDAIIKTGFYQILSEGKATLYKKETKRIIEKINNTNDLLIYFEIQHNYYVLLNNKYLELKRKKDILALIQGKEKQVIKLLSNAGIGFRKNKEGYLQFIVDYLNQRNQ
jgi:hypothetical protein